MKISGKIGPLSFNVGGELDLRLTQYGSLAVAQVDPKYSELSKHGRLFCAVMGNGSTFLAPVTAYPTTAFTMALYNPEGSDRIYQILYAFSFLASGTPDQNGALLVAVSRVAQARPTLSTGENGGYANSIISSLNGMGAGATQAVFINAITLTGPTPAWIPIRSEPGSSTGATIASHAKIGAVEGMITVREGHMFGMTELAGAGTTPLYGFGVIFADLAVR